MCSQFSSVFLRHAIKWLAIILLSMTSIFYPIQKVNAITGIEETAIGTTVGVGIAWLLGLFGLTGASDAIYESVEALGEWGQEQINDMIDYGLQASVQTATGIIVTANEIYDWCTDVASGVLDTASDCYKIFKNWISSLFAEQVVVASGPTLVTEVSGYEVSHRNYTTYTTSYDLYYPFTGTFGTKLYDISTIGFSTSVIPVAEMWTDVYIINFISAEPFTMTLVNSGNVYTLESSEITTSTGYVYYEVANFRVKGGSLTTRDYFTVSAPYFVTSASSTSTIAETYLPLNRTITVADSGTYEYWKEYGTLDDFSYVGENGESTTIPLSIPSATTITGTLEGLRNGTLSWDDVLEEGDVIAVDVDKEVVVTKEGVTDIPITDVITVTDTTTSETDTDTDNDTSLKAELTSIFPFCIPFDLIDFLAILSADPEAPKFTVPISVPTDLKGTMATKNLVIDLSRFDDFAEMIRNFELFAFTVSLILLTRSIIRS